MDIETQSAQPRRFLAPGGRRCSHPGHSGGVAIYLMRRSRRCREVIKTDERRLRQILLNLLGNAVKFTDRGSVCFRVSSARRPMDAQQYTPAVRSGRLRNRHCRRPKWSGSSIHSIRSAERHRPVEGTGLGLAISQRLVALLGGRLDRVERARRKAARSRSRSKSALGESALATGDACGGLNLGLQRPPSRAFSSADDKADNRCILGRLLQSLGFVVDEAENRGARGRARRRTLARPDLHGSDHAGEGRPGGHP